tara:strand:+ start:82519 stop:83748 length:1230 start_codon:yes stop_codon:yes gene_type:complete
MARSLGLAAYRALARRGEVSATPDLPARPKGELVWIHAADAGNMIAILDLASRLCATRHRLNLLITLPEATEVADFPQCDSADLIACPVPSEHPTSVAAFLDHWKPDLCIWTWGALRPNLILETAARKCPLMMIDADTGGFDGRRDRWMPDLTRRMLSLFEVALTRSDAALRRLIQLGLPPSKGQATSPLLAGGQALGCADSDLADMSRILVGRPAWFATQVLTEEIPVVLSAHRQAMRLSHRLLLILHIQDPKDATLALEKAQARDFNALHWGGAQYPDDTTQVLIADDAADRGLFFRIAPVSFLGSSLVAGHGGCDPFEAAALGSAVLYGPKVRHFLPSYSRLATAGAARIVNDAAALGTAVSRLIAPDQAATMAHAGWDVISQGAELADRVIDLVQDTLDVRAGAS